MLSLATTVFVRYVAQDPAPVEGSTSLKRARGGRLRGGGQTLSFYVVAIGVSLVVPLLAVGLYLAIAVYLTVPARTVHRLLRAAR